MADLDIYARFIFGLIFVLGLIGAFAWAARRFGLLPGAVRMAVKGNRRLSIVEVAGIDAKRRMVLVRRDDVEHLILLGSDSETVIERGITPPDAVTFAASERSQAANMSQNQQSETS